MATLALILSIISLCIGAKIMATLALILSIISLCMSIHVAMKVQKIKTDHDYFFNNQEEKTGEK